MPKGYVGFQKGELNPSKSPERREQLRQMRLGKKTPVAQRRKISRSMKRALKDPELRRKWSEVKIGHKQTPETIQKILATKAMKPKSRKTLKKKADTIFSRYIRMRDSRFVNGEWVGNCITCGKRIPAFGRLSHAGHFMSRRYSSTRYDKKNVHLQCAGCNSFHGGEQFLYSLKVDSLYGAGTARLLAEKAHTAYKLSTFELEDIIKESLAEIAAFERKAYGNAEPTQKAV